MMNGGLCVSPIATLLIPRDFRCWSGLSWEFLGNPRASQQLKPSSLKFPMTPLKCFWSKRWLQHRFPWSRSPQSGGKEKYNDFKHQSAFKATSLVLLIHQSDGAVLAAPSSWDDNKITEVLIKIKKKGVQLKVFGLNKFLLTSQLTTFDLISLFWNLDWMQFGQSLLWLLGTMLFTTLCGVWVTMATTSDLSTGLK